MGFLRIFVFGLTVLFCLSAAAVGDEPVGRVRFTPALQITEEFEQFANGVAQSLFSDFLVTTIALERDDNQQLVNRFDEAYLAGTFYGELDAEGARSSIGAEFSIETGIEQQREIEFEIHIKAKGSISEPRSFLIHQLKKFENNCTTSWFGRQLDKVGEAAAQAADTVVAPVYDSASMQDLINVKKSACATFDAHSDWQSLPTRPLAKIFFEGLKANLLGNIEDLGRSDLEPIRLGLMNFITENVSIVESATTTSLSIDLSDLSATFSDQGRDFLNAYELRDYHYKKIQIDVSDEAIDFDYHLVKLHVKNRFKLYMTILANMPDLLSSKESGLAVGADIRRGKGASAIVRGNSTWSESGVAASLYADGLLGNDVGEAEVIEDEEEGDELDELGLD